jgi:hypothetical protein
MIVSKTMMALALLYSTSLIAQKKTFSGYFITQQGDTVQGVFPAYTEWNRNPSRVEFIPTASPKSILLTPQSCQKFVVEGYDEYLSFVGQRLVNPIEDQEVIKEDGFGRGLDVYENVETFLRLVIRTSGGELYSLKDRKRTNFFFSKPGQSFLELKYKRYVDQSQIQDIPEYRKQLSDLFASFIESKKLNIILQKLPYQENELSSFLQSLFPTEIQHKQRNHVGGWVVSIGTVMNMININADSDEGLVARKYNTYFSPLLSVGYLFPVDRNLGRYFIYPQVKLFYYKNTGELNRGNYIKATTFRADMMASMELNGGVNVVNRDNIRIYLTAGINLVSQINGKEVEQYYKTTDHSAIGSAQQVSLEPMTYTINTSVGVICRNKLLLSGAYMAPAQLINGLPYAPKLSGIQFRIGYKLK